MNDLIWCPKFKINVNPEMEENCLGCIFWDKEKKICFFDEWLPGLKKENE